jgi:two-component system phosphate regulon sensor histidine kinase PhoR
MKKILQNLFFRIGIFNIIVLILANILIYNIMEQFILDELRAEFEKKVALARPQIDINALEQEDQKTLKEFADRLKSLTDLRITILNRQGRVLADSDVPSEELGNVENHLSRDEIQDALKNGAGIASRRSRTIDEELIYYSETIRKDGKIIGFLRTAIFMPEVNAKLSFIKSLILKVDLIVISMISITVLLALFHYRKRLAFIGDKLATQLDQGNVEYIPYQDDLYINRVSRELNKVLEWSQGRFDASVSDTERLKNILNSIISGVMAFSPEGQIIFVNDSFRKIFRIDADDLEQEEIYKWIHFPPLIRDIEVFLRDKTLPEITNTIKFYDETYIEYRIFRQKLGGEKEPGYLLTVRDITRLQQLETVRRDFVANVSHEFKTPLSSIRGYAETLITGATDDDETRIKFLKKIERQTIRLENLVADLLQLAKIEKKDMSDLTRIDVAAMIQEIVEEFNPMARQAGLTLEQNQVESDAEIRIEANPDLVRTILANLLSNAIQYNRPQGKVTVRLKKADKFCIIQVEDTGIGISKEEKKRIFERFFRTNDARAIFTDGTGLGLSIVKNAVDSLSGQIDVASELGKGTVFTVKLPLAPEPQIS